MMDMLSETQWVALIGLGGGILLGLAARLGRFCTLGAIEDVLYGGSDVRLRLWGVAIGVAIMGSFGLISVGALDARQSYYLSVPWMPMASILGGLTFGYGMALAGNCGFGAIARLGGGDLRSFVIVLVMGVSAYGVLNGPLAPLRTWLFPQGTLIGDIPPGVAHTVAHATGAPLGVVGLLIGLLVLSISLGTRRVWAAPGPLIWAVVVGLAIVSGWAGTQWVAARGFDGLPVVSHSFSAPVGEAILWTMTG
ncbi:MAG: YeeE/YedE thiosulfate transporter family protein, partial [Paracoccaceae bacterium]